MIFACHTKTSNLLSPQRGYSANRFARRLSTGHTRSDSPRQNHRKLLAVVQRMERMIKIMKRGFESRLCENGLHEDSIVRSEPSIMNREPSEVRQD